MYFKKTSRTTKPPRPKQTKTVQISAPVNGLNKRDSFSRMDPACAILATNWLIDNQGFSARQGWRWASSGLEGRVETLMVYKGQTGSSDRLFAAAGSKIYDASIEGVTPTTVVTGQTSARFTYVSHTTNGGNYLVAANGSDPARYYGPSGWQTFALSGTAAIGNISGSITNLSNWKHVMTHQRRLWIVPTNSTSAHYLPIDSMGGAATAFDFGPVFKRGGSLHSLFSWSTDNATGITNYLIALSSEGDAAIYQGSNPNDAANWSLLGTWELSEPLGQNCFVRFQADGLYLGKGGIYPLTAYLRSGTLAPNSALTSIIDKEFSGHANTVASLPGWGMQFVPNTNYLIVNVPQANPQQNVQYVMNTTAQGGWTKWEGVPASCWAIFNDRVLFGAASGIGEAFYGYRDSSDTSGTGGAPIIAKVATAFNYCGEPGRKQFLQAQINLITAVPALQISLGSNVDFRLDSPGGTAIIGYPSSNTWDTGLFGEATWANGSNTSTTQHGLEGIGQTISLTLSLYVNGPTTWVGTDVIFVDAE